MPYLNNRTLGLLHLGEDATLFPGVNWVPDEVWNDREVEAPDGKKRTVQGWKNNPIIKHRLQEEYLKPLPITGLADMDPEEAIRTVSSTVDAALLRNWHRDEKRQRVKSAIVAQQQRIEVPAAPQPDNGNPKR